MTDLKRPTPAKVTSPKYAKWIASKLLPKQIQDNLIGDMEEEFAEQANKDVRLANLWYWQQSMRTCLIYFSQKLKSPTFLGALNILIPLALTFILLLLIALLSNMDDPSIISDTFWDELLRGHIHLAVFTSGFWANWGEFLSGLSISMIINVPSIIFSVLSIGLLMYLSKKQNITAWKTALVGYSLMLTPYGWGLVHIAATNLGPKQIGPIIAVMIITPLFMAIPVSLLVHRKLKKK